MTVSDVELATLAATHDIISLGMLADGERRRRHGAAHDIRARRRRCRPNRWAPVSCPAAAGEASDRRRTGEPGRRGRTRRRDRAVAGGVPLSGFSLADLEQLAARERVTLRALLEEFCARRTRAGRRGAVRSPAVARRSIEEVNIAGLALARLTVHRLPDDRQLPLLKAVAALQRDGRGDPRLRAAAARRSIRPCRRPATTM